MCHAIQLARIKLPSWKSSLRYMRLRQKAFMKKIFAALSTLEQYIIQTKQLWETYYNINGVLNLVILDNSHLDFSNHSISNISITLYSLSKYFSGIPGHIVRYSKCGNDYKHDNGRKNCFWNTLLSIVDGSMYSHHHLYSHADRNLHCKLYKRRKQIKNNHICCNMLVT